MDKVQYNKVQIVFFGAGKKGRYWIENGKGFGIKPKGIVDNNEELWGKQCEDIIIYCPEIIKNDFFDYICITCNKEYEIYQQLLELGVSEDKIVAGEHNILNHFIFWAVKDILPIQKNVKLYNSNNKIEIVFDLQNGMVLGGVETWVYSLAEKLKNTDYHGMYLTTDVIEPIMIDNSYPVHILRYKNIIKYDD